jgi:MFS family permease
MSGVVQTEEASAPAAPAVAAARIPGRTERLSGALYRSASFRQLWLGMIAASVGQWMQQVALGWIALILTDTPWFVGIVTFVGGIPFLIVGPPAGTLIDQIDRRKLLLTLQSISAVVAFTVAAIVLAGVIQPWHLIIAAFANGCVQSLMMPTQQSLVPLLVERRDLTNAIGLMSAGQNMCRVVGPSVAGGLIAWWGVGPAFLAQGIMLLVAIMLVLPLVLPPRTRNRQMTANIFDGLRYIFASEELRALFWLVAIMTFFIYPYLSFINVIARDVLHIGASGLGFLMATSGAGAVVGSLYVAARGRTSGVGVVLVVAGLLYGAIMVGIALSHWTVLTAILMFAAGAVGSASFSTNTALVQHRIPDEVRGRVISAYFLTWGLMPLGALPMGAVADRWGIQAALVLGAVASSILVAILGVTTPVFKKL